jgi:ribose-phosphate pyrophosphokinase
MILINGREFEFGNFPNGETLMNHKQVEEGWKIQRVSFKYESDSDLIKLKFLKDYLDSVGREVEQLLIYYMPYSRMDRSENGSPFTLKYVANFINSLNFKSVPIIEPHSDVTCALVNNSFPVYINYHLVGKVAEQIGLDKEKDYVVFPDSGAQKRYSKILGYNTLVGFKNRNFQTGKIESLSVVGDTTKGGSKALIVDDLSSYGGTFIKTAEALKEYGIDEVYLLVAHAENSIFKGDIFKTGLIDKVFTTDSIMTEHGYWSNKIYKDKLHVIEVEELV